MTARAVDGREEICEWKVDSSVISVMVDMVSIKGKKFKAPSLVHVKSTSLIVVLLISLSWMTGFEWTNIQGFQETTECVLIDFELFCVQQI